MNKKQRINKRNLRKKKQRKNRRLLKKELEKLFNEIIIGYTETKT